MATNKPRPEYDIDGAFETVRDARVRFSRDLDALMKQHVIENELSILDLVACLEDAKFRRMVDLYDLANRRPKDDE